MVPKVVGLISLRSDPGLMLLRFVYMEVISEDVKLTLKRLSGILENSQKEETESFGGFERSSC